MAPRHALRLATVGGAAALKRDDIGVLAAGRPSRHRLLLSARRRRRGDRARSSGGADPCATSCGCPCDGRWSVRRLERPPHRRRRADRRSPIADSCGGFCGDRKPSISAFPGQSIGETHRTNRRNKMTDPRLDEAISRRRFLGGMGTTAAGVAAVAALNPRLRSSIGSLRSSAGRFCEPRQRNLGVLLVVRRPAGGVLHRPAAGLLQASERHVPSGW